MMPACVADQAPASTCWRCAAWPCAWLVGAARRRCWPGLVAARQDTPAWMKGFLDTFYNIEQLRGTLVSDQAYQASWNLAVTASATAVVACIPTWETDFRADLPRIEVPMLVIQGDDDQVLPYAKTGARLTGLLSDVQTVLIAGGPHTIAWTHAEQVNSALLKFMA